MMILDNRFDFRQLLSFISVIFHKRNFRFKPEFRFTVSRKHMNMHFLLFTREKKEAVPFFTENRRTHIIP